MPGITIHGPLNESKRIYTGTIEFGPDEKYPVLFRPISQDQVPIFQHIINQQKQKPGKKRRIPWNFGILRDHKQLPHEIVLITEYVKGQTLKDYYTESPLSNKQTTYLLISLCKTLEELHELLGIIHGDIKPENIVINYDKQEAYLIDLDFSTITDQRNYSKSKGFSPPYACIEQLQGMAGPKTDIRCLALSLIEARLGHHPHEKIIGNIKDPVEAANILAQQYLAPHKQMSQTAKLLCKCTHPEYEKRPSTEEILAKLEAETQTDDIIFATRSVV